MLTDRLSSSRRSSIYFGSSASEIAHTHTRWPVSRARAASSFPSPFLDYGSQFQTGHRQQKRANLTISNVGDENMLAKASSYLASCIRARATFLQIIYNFFLPFSPTLRLFYTITIVLKHLYIYLNLHIPIVRYNHTERWKNADLFFFPFILEDEIIFQTCEEIYLLLYFFYFFREMSLYFKDEDIIIYPILIFVNI